MFFAVTNKHINTQTYSVRSTILFKQVVAVIRKKKYFSGETIKIINELLTIFIYKEVF